VGALIDLGGESKLERRFLALIRQAGLPRPHLQRIYRAGARTIARVDAEFEGDVIVELDGHGTHASRAQRQRDAQRRTELTLLGKRLITFTYDDVYGRPDWALDQLRTARSRLAA
jgi:very-short-patch-repair endonuclease